LQCSAGFQPALSRQDGGATSKLGHYPAARGGAVRFFVAALPTQAESPRQREGKKKAITPFFGVVAQPL